MLLIDDLLTAPFRGLLWIFQEVADAAEQELEAEADRIKDDLRDLYMMLETGQITEDEFDAQEQELLDRLDELEEDERGVAVELAEDEAADDDAADDEAADDDAEAADDEDDAAEDDAADDEPDGA